MSKSFFTARTYARSFLPGGEAQRDAGMALVTANHADFAYQYFHTILAMRPGTIFLNEDIKANWTGVYAKPQAWGAMVNSCIRAGLIEHLTQETKMRLPKSHARKTHWLRRTGATAEFKPKNGRK